jgi:ubiquinone/menaquinone biosynthesis C-methylase UbiE
MKYRDSGMPNEEMWSTFFDPNDILIQMEVDSSVETILGLDIEEEMILSCKNKLDEAKIQNVELVCGDVSSDETLRKLKTLVSGFDYITLFNILHCEEPTKLLKAVYSLLETRRYSLEIRKNTKRPALEIKPKPEQIVLWANKVITF